ncbi:MAG: SAM-dependent methyltransferase [Planctomycetota bacterium]
MDDSIWQPSGFIFVICQHGAEAATKLEILSNHPDLKLSFSRPGFITFKVEPGMLPVKFNLKSTLARTYGWSLGRLENSDANPMVAELLHQPTLLQADRIHVYQRDSMLPGKNGFEPGVNALASTVAEKIETALPESDSPPMVNRVARVDQTVFDVVLIEPNQWWFGFHVANTTAGRWVGGAPQFETTQEVFSRAYFKLKEALLWSGLHIQPGDICVELGSSPGGACQLMLELGATVIGIDPAEMEQEILDHENFTHIRRRVNEVKHRDFKPVKWLIADLNTDPQFTIDTVREILNYEQVNIKGLVLTMKLSDLNLTKKVPTMISDVKGLGFKIVKTRQLAFNRREFCLVAFRNKFVLRDSRRTT